MIALSALFAAAAAARADMIGHGGLIRSIAMSPDGRLALTASFDYTARLWRFDEQRELQRLDGHDGPVNAAVFAPGGRQAVTVGADGRLIVWTLADGDARHVVEAHEGRAMSVVLSADGATALTGGWDGRLALWEVASGRRLDSFDTGTPITAVAFGPDEASLVAGGRDGVIRLVRRRDGIVIGGIKAHDLGLTSVVGSRNGRRLLSIGLDNHARVWNLASQALVSEYLPKPATKPVAAALSADGRAVLVGYLDGRLLLLDAGSGSVQRTLEVEDGPVWAVAFSRDTRFALTAGVEERVKVWHLATGDRISTAGDDDANRPMPWLASDHPGARTFRKCANCHALTRAERQRSGPHFAGLFGRRAGTVAGYRYSGVLRRSDVIWDRQTIAELFRLGPDRYMPGTKMPVQQIADEGRLTDLIDYLQQIAPPD